MYVHVHVHVLYCPAKRLEYDLPRTLQKKKKKFKPDICILSGAAKRRIEGSGSDREEKNDLLNLAWGPAPMYIALPCPPVS